MLTEQQRLNLLGEIEDLFEMCDGYGMVISDYEMLATRIEHHMGFIESMLDDAHERGLKEGRNGKK